MTIPNGNRPLHNEHELVPRHQEVDSNLYELDEDINPDSDASLLRKHFTSNNESHGSLIRTETPVGPFQRLISFMSRTPLLLRSSPAQGTGSYGALPVHDLSFSTDGSEIDEEDVDDIRRRDRRKGKGSALRQVVTNESSRSRHIRRSSNGSTTTRRARRRQSEPAVGPTLPVAHTLPTEVGGKLFENILLDTNSAESTSGMIEDTDSDDDGWSVDDSPDNSPLVQVFSNRLFRSEGDTIFMFHTLAPMSLNARFLSL